MLYSKNVEVAMVKVTPSTLASVATAVAPRSAGARWRGGLRRATGIGIALACAVSLTPAAAQQFDPRAIELSPAVLDRWLVVQKAMVARIKQYRAAGKSTKPSETEVQALVVEACGKAGFANLAECISTTGYVGFLISGYDPQTRRYIDPLLLTGRRLTEIEKSTQITEAEKEKARENAEAFRRMVMGPVPKAHLELLDSYHKRIVEANR
jgi:hypothetical protein